MLIRVIKFIYLSDITLLNPLNAELNPISHLLALVGSHHILHVGRARVNPGLKIFPISPNAYFGIHKFFS
jgi:hypothetical protein